MQPKAIKQIVTGFTVLPPCFLIPPEAHTGSTGRINQLIPFVDEKPNSVAVTNIKTQQF
jgi:hypothetical protein